MPRADDHLHSKDGCADNDNDDDVRVRHPTVDRDVKDDQVLDTHLSSPCVERHEANVSCHDQDAVQQTTNVRSTNQDKENIQQVRYDRLNCSSWDEHLNIYVITSPC